MPVHKTTYFVKIILYTNINCHKFVQSN